MAAAEKCLAIDVMCNAKNGLSNAVTGAVGDATDNLANQVLEAFASVIASLGTLWVNVGTPNLTNTGGASSVDGASAPGVRELTTVLGYVTWVSLAVAIIALTVLGALIATRIRTGEGIASLGKVGLILGGVALVGGAGSIVSALLPNGPVGVSGTVAFLQSSLWPYMLIAAALSVVVGGARMFWESRAEPGKDLLRSLLTLAVVGGAGVTVVALLVTAADRFSVWVINNSLACDVTAADGACFEENVGALLGLGATAGVPGQPSLGSVLVIIFGLIAILASVVQIVLMVARSGMLVILAGILPLAASFTNTEMGRSWFRKCIGWLVAFILYKPAAAVVYAAAFQLTGTDVFADDGSGILAVVTGLMLMVLALFAMPALMRFVTPMVSSLAAGGGGAAVAAGTMAAIPTGAAAVGRLATGAGGGGAAAASNAAPQRSSHNTNTTTSTTTTSPTGAGQGGSKGSTPAPTGSPAAGGAQAASAGGGAATGAAAGGSAAAGGAAATGAGAAAGPAGAAVAAGLQAGQAASSAVKGTADQITGDGPSGSS
ncbi:hypothetical protein [Georgenia daeguensis]|uniref:Uncharacterized protein n=1 Tax=Georgenia daeguensis TaxID=908355 RepID=A0ABP6UQR7_9MICO